MNSCELASFVTAIACSIAKCFSKEDTAILAVVFTQLGDTLGTIIANDELKNSNCLQKQNSDI